MIGDYKSQITEDENFAEKEKPSYADDSEDQYEKSVQVKSITHTNQEPDDESELVSELVRSQITEGVNPGEFKIGDGDISKFDEKGIILS